MPKCAAGKVYLHSITVHDGIFALKGAVFGRELTILPNVALLVNR